MTPNIGTTDRSLRILIGLALFVAPLVNFPAIWTSGLWAYVTMGVGVVLGITAIWGLCPLYKVLGLSTRKA